MGLDTKLAMNEKRGSFARYRGGSSQYV